MTTIRVIDFEASGTAPPEAEVCEVGLCDVLLEERQVTPPRSWLCRVTAMPPEARAVHHISLADCATCEPFDPGVILAETPSAWAARYKQQVRRTIPARRAAYDLHLQGCPARLA